MGSFSSKMNVSAAQNNDSGRKLPSGMAGSSKTQAREEAANADKAKAGATNREQPFETKKRPSFSWLVETPVVLHTSAKEQEDKGKKNITEGKGKSNNAATQSDKKYVKSIELPSKSHASSSSSSSEKHGSYKRHDSTSSGENREKRHANQMKHSPKNNEDVSPTASEARYPVGFGVVGKKDSSTRSKDGDGSGLSLLDSKGEGRRF